MGPCLFVDALRFFTLANDAADGAIAYGHDKIAHSRVLRKREHVDGFDLAAVWVVKALRHTNLADEAVDRSVHCSVLERNWYKLI